MPKVSVIVPIYNVEKYIERCAISLLKQTLDDIEYIFIDDCTPDNSMEILKKTLQKFPAKAGSIRIVRMAANSRQAAVRSQGIQLATGDFIIHCDSDDWVDTDLYEKMYQEAIRSNADVVTCPIKDEYSDSSIVRKPFVLPAKCKTVVKDWYKRSVSMYCWNKLVRRSVYTDNNILPFDGINMWEDNGLMLRVMYYADGLSSVEGSFYHYNQANTSAMTNCYGRNAIDQMIRCAILLEDFFKSESNYDEYKNTVNALKYFAKLNLVTTRFDWYDEFKNLFPESNYIVNQINLSSFSTKGKIRFLMVKHNMGWLFVLLFKIANSLKS